MPKKKVVVSAPAKKPVRKTVQKKKQPSGLGMHARRALAQTDSFREGGEAFRNGRISAKAPIPQKTRATLRWTLHRMFEELVEFVEKTLDIKTERNVEDPDRPVVQSWSRSAFYQRIRIQLESDKIYCRVEFESTGEKTEVQYELERQYPPFSEVLQLPKILSDARVWSLIAYMAVRMGKEFFGRRLLIHACYEQFEANRRANKRFVKDLLRQLPN